MGKGMTVFNETHCYACMNRPNTVSLKEIETTWTKYSRLCTLMDSVFSALHSKRGDVTEKKIGMLKYDINLVRIKWNEIHLSYVPKFHMLYEHVPDILLNLNGFYDVGEDSIEQWHQISLRHHDWIRFLRSAHKQNHSQAKNQLITSNTEFNNVIADTKEKKKN